MTVNDAPGLAELRGEDGYTLTVPDIAPGTDALTVALEFAKAGWYVLPVARGSKRPGSVVGKGWQHQSTRDPETIVAWWAGADHGIALHCGRSGALVFDVDHPDKIPDVLAARLADAPYQATRPDMPGRGHYIFAMPEGRMLGNGTGQLGGAWGEIRGANGVIIIAPSQHPDGGEYRWIRTGSVPELPGEIASILPDGSDSQDSVSDARRRSFIAECTGNSRPDALRPLVASQAAKIGARESRHMAVLWPMAEAMREAKAGLYPARAAIEALAEDFVPAAMANFGPGRYTRSKESAVAELLNVVNWAIGQADALTDEELEGVRARVSNKIGTPNEVRPREQTDSATSSDSGKTPEHSGQLRMALRLQDAASGELLYMAGIGWHYWDGKRWTPDDSGVAKRAVIKVLETALGESLKDPGLRRDVQKCESASGIAGVLEIAAALPEFAATVRDMDADPYLLNVNNGTLDLRTLELRPHAPADRLTKICRGSFRPDTSSVAWGPFLARILPDADVREFMQRYVGLGLLGEVREHALVIGVGTGQNGKSVFDTAVRFALGDYAITAEPDLFMHRDGAHPTGEMDLRGVRWVAVLETDKDRRMAEATMKRLTGGDAIRARRMRQDFVEFAPSHTALLLTNFLPKVSGDDGAVWRRLRVVPFGVTIPEGERDPKLSAQLQLEADAVLSWAIAGWVQYQRRGLDEPAGVRIATDDFHVASDALARFITERCVTSTPNRKTTTSRLYEAWQRWAADDGAEPMSQKAFGLALDRRGYPVTHRQTNGRWRSGIDLHDVCDEFGSDDA